MAFQNGGSIPRSNAKKEGDKVRFFPNPFTKGVFLSFEGESEETIKVLTFNNIGIQLFLTEIKVNKGSNQKYLETFENLPSGMYTMKIITTNGEYQKRVIKIE